MKSSVSSLRSLVDLKEESATGGMRTTSRFAAVRNLKQYVIT